MNFAVRCIAAFLLLAGATRVCATVLVKSAAPARCGDDSQDDGLPAGLLANYSSGAGEKTVHRTDSDIQFNWGEASPDPRVPADRFAVQWQGKLLVPASGRYQIHFFAAGKVRLNLAGKQLIAGTTAEPRWLSSEPTTLEPGYHAIDLTFEKTGEHARIGLYWQSNKFGIEPIVPRWLFHERSIDHEPGDFERGDELVRAFRCAACHTIPGVAVDRNAPSLDRLNGAIDPDWLARWIENPHGIQSNARMPAMGLSRNDARAVASFLLSSSKKAETSATAPAKGNPELGESLVRSLGCLACHTLNGNGSSAAGFGGGPLDRVADKRPAGFFREWLTKPQTVNSAHRMPTFTLSKDEVDDLASFLATCREPPDADVIDAITRASDAEINRGKQLVVDRRCAACHDIPGVAKPDLVSQPLHGDRSRQRRIEWLQSCLNQTPTTNPRPRYAFDEADRKAIVSFFDQLPGTVASQSQFELGRRLLRELNCASCHPRDLDHGLQPSMLGHTVNGAETELAKLRGELEPPSLTSVGDKFHDATLAKLIEGGLTPRRPWLKVRMPRFDHRDAERDAILSYLINHDRIPDDPPSSTLHPQTASAPDPAAAFTAGHQLVSARGFGCMSCHTVGKHQPKAVVVNARGSDLLKVGDRLRHEWFLRWTRDPARIVPGMEMPSITVPVRGVLDDKLDLQIESLWQALNSPSFVVPSDRDTAQQIISLKPGDAPVILRDVMYDCPPGSGWCPRAFAIGLPNRHNILFDLDTMSLRGWWVGDFARERTEGKSWLWEPAGLPVWDQPSGVPGIALRNTRNGKILFPERIGQSIGSLVAWSNKTNFVTIRYRLQFAAVKAVYVFENLGRPTIFPDDPLLQRQLAVFVYGASADLEPVVLHSGGRVDEAKPNECRVDGPLGESLVVGPATSRWKLLEATDTAKVGKPCFALPLKVAAGDPRNRHAVTLTYLPSANAQNRLDGTGTTPPTEGAGGSLKVQGRTSMSPQVVPGLEVIRLPVDSFVMPTALAFRPDGSPAVCSLKGRVFLARDTDDDGIEDTWQPYSDHLAAPYGIVTDGNDVIVSHKPELLRLVDNDDQSRAERTRVIASGWGITEDYHDWTFGVVRDAHGNFYIGTGSDYAHKNRPQEARKWRGRILKVTPRGEGEDGQIEELARGARYPTGLAKNRDGAIFFTDNQGVQNTFNEINHVIPGSRYGVPALDDPPPDKDPWPEREPAIKIPHPWTRSVNGICFLDGPTDESRDRVREMWGPFAGHGIGCEYDTRGLIRFSLQKVGDTYQGACYPFTLPEDQVPQDQRLLGPICCAVSPNGDLYVGGLRDSGWGGGNNVGELVRIKPSERVPLGIREVRAWREGFVIDFTGPINGAAAADAANYTISSYRRIWKGTYATPDSDRRTEKIRKIDAAQDRRSVILTLDGMRPGFVYDIHLKGIGLEGQTFWPADAYYTLNQIIHEDAPNVP